MGTARMPSLAKKRRFVGLNKGGHDGGACLIDVRRPRATVELFLKERFTRRKHDGEDLTPLLLRLNGNLGGLFLPRRPCAHTARGGGGPGLAVAENSFGDRPSPSPQAPRGAFPLGRFLDRLGHRAFHKGTNPELRFLTHHFCHAAAAAAVSPFSSSLIVVFDGAGNKDRAFGEDHPEFKQFPPPPRKLGSGPWCECVTVYLQKGPRLDCVGKEWQRFEGRPTGPGGDPLHLSTGLGMFYETAALFIFGSNRAAGKVMGLAALGTPRPVGDRIAFLRGLDWSKAFRGGGKSAWEASPHRRYWADVAASVQRHFEESLDSMLAGLARRFPGVSNLVLTGGCALNCAANIRVARAGPFARLFVPPFPGDESIAFGAAHALLWRAWPSRWRPAPWARQAAAFGPSSSRPTPARVRRALRGFRLERLADPAEAAARLLAGGRVVAWFQGRSESGPRALGHRSILAHPGLPGMKDRLNAEVKLRESFRPYGCSVLWERARECFDVEPGFDSPFMSFAPAVRPAWAARLREVTHADGTSRIQTVRRTQDRLFHRLLSSFAGRTGIPAVLNTSLNVMGEPIVETLADLRRSLETTPLDAAIAGDFLVRR